jgi:hypothetical protein
VLTGARERRDCGEERVAVEPRMLRRSSEPVVFLLDFAVRANETDRSGPRR